VYEAGEVPHWKETLTSAADPSDDRLPFNLAVFVVIFVALPVATAGGTLEVIKLISLP
jgi:hypothetical protein